MRFYRRHRELIEGCLVVAGCAAIGGLFAGGLMLFVLGGAGGL